jgi:tetratricopeptide (TPR) repeat protein
MSRLLAHPDGLEARVAAIVDGLRRPQGLAFSTRYHEKFADSGIEKANNIIEQLRTNHPSLDLARCAYLSVGGSDGSEIETVMQNTQIRHGVLLEYEPAVIPTLFERVKRLEKQGKTLKMEIGDAMMRISSCRDHLLRWREQGGIYGIICSIQAVLHELPSRSPDFDIDTFLGTMFWDFAPCLLYMREPCRPDGWPDRVKLRLPDLSSDRLAELAKQIAAYRNIPGHVRTAGPHFAKMPSGLAAELLSKLFYLDDYHHEIQEQVTWIDPSWLKRKLEEFLGENTVASETVASDSFQRYYRSFGVEARDLDGNVLEMPRPFVRVVAARWDVNNLTLPTNRQVAPVKSTQSEIKGIETPSDGPDKVATQLTRSQQIVNLPYGSLGTLLKGRAEFLTNLRLALTGTVSSGVVTKAVFGLGGVGKTRASVEYAWAYTDTYSALLFAVADSPDGLHHNLAAFAGPLVLNLPEQHNHEQNIRLRATLNWLNTHPGWLLILDNVDSPETLAEAVRVFARVSGGHIIITTRLSNFPAGISPIEIDVLTIEEAAAFLLERSEPYRAKKCNDGAEARHLSHDIGQLSIALEHSAAYISVLRISIERYRALWRENWERVAGWSDETLTLYPRAVAATWQISVDKLSERARRLLGRLSWLSRDPIPEFLFDVAPPGERANDTREALSELIAYSLLRFNESRAFVLIHPLVQQVTRRTFTDEENTHALTKALEWLTTAVPDKASQPENWPKFDQIASHVKEVAERALVSGINSPTTLLMSQLGHFFLSSGQYARARPLFEQLVSLCETELGATHLQTATALSELGYVLNREGKYAEAKPYFERALSICEKSRNPNRLLTANTLSHLGGLLHVEGHHAISRRYFERALEIRQEVLKEDDPLIASVLDNLAGVLRSLGDVSGARRLRERALKIYETVLGPGNPETLICLDNYAGDLCADGDLAGAIERYGQVSTLYEAVLGPDHPETATCLHNFASALREQGDLDRARRLLERVIAIDEKRLGGDHPYTAKTLVQLGEILEAQNEISSARKHFERARKISENALGSRPGTGDPGLASRRGIIWTPPSADISTPRASARSTKVGRNQLCPCGSGKKYKRCHGYER